MARNQTLLKILNDVRGEARLSLNPAHNVSDRDAQIGLIQREQERLWADYDWPHLIVDRYLQAEEGRRYYEIRTAYNEEWAARSDLSLDRVIEISVFDGGMWRRLDYGIRDCDRYSHNSLSNERSWPPRRWQRAEDDKIEIWPLPDVSGVYPQDQNSPPNMEATLRVKGVRDLRPFRDDADRADLDDRLLTLYCAAALLAESGAKDTNLKLEAAQRHYTRIKADVSHGEPFSLFGVRRPHGLPRHSHISRYIRPE